MESCDDDKLPRRQLRVTKYRRAGDNMQTRSRNRLVSFRSPRRSQSGSGGKLDRVQKEWEQESEIEVRRESTPHHRRRHRSFSSESGPDVRRRRLIQHDDIPVAKPHRKMSRRKASLRKMASMQNLQELEGPASDALELMDISPDYSEETPSSSQTLQPQEEKKKNKPMVPCPRPLTPLPHYAVPAIPDTPFTENYDLDKAEEIDVEKELRGLFINDPQVSDPRPFSYPALELIKPKAQIPLKGIESSKDASCSHASISTNQTPAPPSDGEASKTQENENALANICARPPTPLPRFTDAMLYLFGQGHELTSLKNIGAFGEIFKVLVDDQEPFGPRQLSFLKQIYIPMTMRNFILQFKNLMEKLGINFAFVSKTGTPNFICLTEREANPEDSQSDEEYDNPIPTSSGRRNAIPIMSTIKITLLADNLDSDDDLEFTDDEDSDDE